jgi:hypothetical protein
MNSKCTLLKLGVGGREHVMLATLVWAGPGLNGILITDSPTASANSNARPSANFSIFFACSFQHFKCLCILASNIFQFIFLVLPLNAVPLLANCSNPWVRPPHLLQPWTLLLPVLHYPLILIESVVVLISLLLHC